MTQLRAGNHVKAGSTVRAGLEEGGGRTRRGSGSPNGASGWPTLLAAPGPRCRAGGNRGACLREAKRRAVRAGGRSGPSKSAPRAAHRVYVAGRRRTNEVLLLLLCCWRWRSWAGGSGRGHLSFIGRRGVEGEEGRVDARGGLVGHVESSAVVLLRLLGAAMPRSVRRGGRGGRDEAPAPRSRRPAAQARKHNEATALLGQFRSERPFVTPHRHSCPKAGVSRASARCWMRGVAAPPPPLARCS